MSNPDEEIRHFFLRKENFQKAYDFSYSFSRVVCAEMNSVFQSIEGIMKKYDFFKIKHSERNNFRVVYFDLDDDKEFKLRIYFSFWYQDSKVKPAPSKITYGIRIRKNHNNLPDKLSQIINEILNIDRINRNKDHEFWVVLNIDLLLDQNKITNEFKNFVDNYAQRWYDAVKENQS